MVTVRFFAVLKSLVGQETFSLEIEKGTSLEEVLERLQGEFPALKEIIREKRVLISVNQEVVEKHCLIRDGDEIAFLPPFAGGGGKHDSRQKKRKDSF